ncbi:rhamnolipids biosynthesis 3-oxoacyl-[acyl-carrier-protein] reductase [Pseudozyma hubeiensis SY62]|uniref:Rhamnolipids biosynthesis 3-oxoacyl-[acyl-carrier-protein] reductase n=1 Tax=Pseudozyma hubeiensis (strain SY62) TaxID=1305764 RepID=R9PB99_PSEHS|nr:rhamnolipids biosynthesis 3-oxoacyl-[acyl-carrier-protein] reductase [Pseudozyma hubeiensis SY62]GAC98629.1 rhamnolipids biosynthesis 3-oxoacyl-[acyl-carrier-protein] reductase [Pseudozyma hubeiensis SY62]
MISLTDARDISESNTQAEAPRALADITSRSLNLPSRTTSSLTADRRASWTGEGVGKKRKSTLQANGSKVYRVKRRNAISLNEEQARCLARSLSCLPTPNDNQSQESCSQHDIAGRIPKRERHEPRLKEEQESSNLTIDQTDNIKRNAALLPFKTIALQPNLFLLTRTDGLAFTDPLVPASTL